MLQFSLVVIIAVTAWWSMVDIMRSDEESVRTLPRWMWLVTVLALPVFGAFAWALTGRPIPEPLPVRVLAPDDDAEFLRELARRARGEHGEF